MSPHRRRPRVLWLVNHSTLRAFEVPLVSLGIEVYTSKLYPRHQATFRSASADYSFDTSLTIPEGDLARLNAHDFYQQPLFPGIRAIVNRHFDAAICGFFPEMIREFVNDFDGILLLRAFGLAANDSYRDILERMGMGALMDRFARMGPRFRFAECYSTIHQAEPDVFRRSAVHLPLGLPEETWKQQEAWTGGRKEVLFFCPSINVAPKYYGEIYRQFIGAFGDLPHIINGEQRIPVDDPAVRGFRPREEVLRDFRECAVMFYHSTETRHLHYHPLEAIVCGMPLVFMRQGYLGLLDPAQPGACDTLAEARRKVERVLAGDRELIDSIRRRQVTLLDTFTWEHCRQAWLDRFVPLLDATRGQPRPRRIAVMLTGPYRGGTLASTKNIARMIRVGSAAAGAPADVVVSCYRGQYRVQEEFADLAELGITVRETEWQPIARSAVAEILKLDGRYAALQHSDYTIPRDGANDFLDCDHWLLVGDRTALPLAPIRPYGVVAHDFVQRYVPEMFGPFHEHGTFTTLRGADYLLVTTPATGEDAIQYAGVARERVTLVPMEFDPPALVDARAAEAGSDGYIVWPTNSSVHKNHLVALEALQEFLDETETIRKVVITGVNSHLLSPSVELPPEFGGAEHLAMARQFLKSRPRLSKRLDFRGELPRESYLRLVSRARFLLHPATYDNGTYAVVEAAWLGVPAVSADYPGMQFIHSYFDLPLAFFRPSSVPDLVRALRAAALGRDTLAAALPSHERLSQASWRHLASDFWKTMDGLLS